PQMRRMARRGEPHRHGAELLAPISHTPCGLNTVNECLTADGGGGSAVTNAKRYRRVTPQFAGILTSISIVAANALVRKGRNAGQSGAMESFLPRKGEKLLQSIEVLVIDDNQYMRKGIRNRWTRMGGKNVQEGVEGVAGLEAIRMLAPNLVILDWEMPLLTGAELVRIVRSPGVFPVPDIPIIMLTGHGQRWRVIEAANPGVNEVPKKPASRKA